MSLVNSYQPSNGKSLPTERQHAIDVIESLQRLIIAANKICPEFCKGLLPDAFDSAFGLSLIKKRRPLLIYIHHNSRTLNLFSSEIFIEFLAANYVVWPWDISIESNRQKLIRMWREYFSEESLIDFTMDQCPMLIEISRQFSMENISLFKYQPEVLLRNDVLVRTNEEFDPEALLYQLIVFEQEFEKNEKYLSSDFVQKIVTCPELVIEIAEYLPLNDAIATFSMGVLIILWKYNIKLRVVKPSEEFIKSITESNNQDKILSVRLEGNQFIPTMRSASSNTFTNVTSLTIINLRKMKHICEIRTYFPNVTAFHLHYDRKIDFHNIWKILDLLPHSIKRLDIYCDLIKCSHYDPKVMHAKIDKFNLTVEVFVLHLDHTSRKLVNGCVQSHVKCVLRTITDFIRIMSNIRDVRLILNEGSVNNFLDTGEWDGLMNRCQQLGNIYLKGKKSDPYDTSVRKEMENKLRDRRESLALVIRV